MNCIALIRISFLISSLLAYSLSFASASLPAGVVVSISASKKSIDVDDALLIKVDYTNVSDKSVSLYKWGTALGGGITEDLFLVEYLGTEMKYNGIHAKRLAPTSSDFVVLAPGEVSSMAVDLLLSYPVNYEGDYQISLRDSGLVNAKLASPLTVSLTSDRPILALKQPAIFQNCSAGQISQIDAALSSAESIANRAASDLRNAPVSLRPEARRYREWFGAFSTARYATVQSNMDRIASSLSNQRIGFNCDCTGQPGVDPNNTFAFVFPNDPFNMTLCNVFFRVPRLGTDSMSGTIVHEVSHFNVVANTDDFASNQAGIRALANSQPQNAIRAANAYEYFAENSPFLPMPQASDLAADLTIVSGLLLPTVTFADEVLTVSGVIANIGNANSDSTLLRLELINDATGSLLTQTTIPSISSGASFNFQFNLLAPSEEGQYSAELCINVVSGESNANNNCLALSSLTVEDNSVIIAPILQLLLDD